MKKIALTAALAAALALPAFAQSETPAPSPNEIVDAARSQDWVTIAPDDLLVMTVAPDGEGNERTVIMQLMPAPFSQGWVENIRTLARAQWYDGISVNRVQDNYVVQWGDPGYDNPESGDVETKALPEGLKSVDERICRIWTHIRDLSQQLLQISRLRAEISRSNQEQRERAKEATRSGNPTLTIPRLVPPLTLIQKDNYAPAAQFSQGWPLAVATDSYWPVHCYGMVGVGRNYSPDTGSGAELYTVIGHAPRHLDRNIALVGRIISGMEHLSSLPRGSGALGFYTEEEADKRTPILSVRVASDLPDAEQPSYEYLSTESQTFAAYAEARANRRDPFFIVPAGGADVCNIPVPVRAVAGE